MRTAVLVEQEGSQAIQCPTVGRWRPSIGLGAPVAPGTVLGTLEQAGVLISVTAPKRVAGVAIAVTEAGTWVQYGTTLVTMGQGGGELVQETPVRDEAIEDLPAGSTAVCADTDGTVYLRPEPGAAVFAAQGSRVETRTTIALIEVMKTFTPVRAPIAGDVARVCVEDGASVQAGDTLFWLSPKEG